MIEDLGAYTWPYPTWTLILLGFLVVAAIALILWTASRKKQTEEEPGSWL